MSSDYATAPVLFGKWSYEDLEVDDLALADYIAAVNTAQVFLPHTAGRYASQRFRKAYCPIVERMGCALMFHGRNVRAFLWCFCVWTALSSVGGVSCCRP